MAFNVLTGMEYVRQQGEIGRERGKQSRLSELSSQAYGATGANRDALVQQAVGIDPQAGMALGGKLQERSDARGRKALGAAKYVLSAAESGNPAAAKAAYQAVRPFLEEIGRETGKVPPLDYSPDMLPMMHQIIAANEGMGGGTQNNVQSRFVGDDGNVYTVMRDGQIVNSNIKADRQMWFRDHPGMPPELVSKDGSVLRVGQSPPPQDGQVQSGSIQTGDGGQYSANGGAGVEAVIAAEQQRAAAAGEPPLTPREIAGLRMAYQESSATSAPASGGAMARPSEAQVTAEQEQAKADAEFRNYDRMTGLVADRASEEAAAKARADAQAREMYGSDEQRKQQSEAAKKLPQLQNAVRGVGRIEQALQSLGNGLFADTGPVDQFAQRYTKEGQELEAAVGAIQNSMLALTRVPGVGSQSDLEQRVAQLQYPSLDKAPEVNARTMENLRAFVADLEAAYGNVMQGNQQPAQPSGWGIQRVD